MDQIQAMRIFIRIVELGNFSRAAEDLNIPRATVSTTLKNLEQKLGVRLFIRTTRQVKITGEGEIYYQRCLQLLASLEEANTLFVDQKNQPEGSVRIDMPHSLAREIVIPALPAFSARYPRINLKLGADDNAIDMLDQGVDCVLRAWTAKGETLQSRHIADLPQITCASPDYLARQGTPQTLEDLSSHYAVGYFFRQQQPAAQLDFLVGKQTRTLDLAQRLTVSGADAYLAAGKAGYGLIQASRLVLGDALQKGTLVEVLPRQTPPPMPLYIMYPPGRFLAPRVRVLLDWLIELFAALDMKPRRL